MPRELSFVSANIAAALTRRDAAQALRLSLANAPDVIGLQEWTPKRFGLLPPGDYTWFSPLIGGCAVGWRSDRFQLAGKGTRFLSPPARTDGRDRLIPLLPPRAASVISLRERATGDSIALVNYHLVAGVQRAGTYRADRPVLAARHRAEAARLTALSSQASFAMGDSNFDGFALPGFTSAWAGRGDLPGTFGHRHIDDVFGRGEALEVDLIETPSDHRALSVRRAFPT